MANSYNELFGLGSHSIDASCQLHALFQDDAASTTVADRSGNGNNGTLAGGDNTADISVTGPNSWLTKALRFDGSADVVTFPNFWSGDNDYILGCRVSPVSTGRSDFLSIWGDATAKRRVLLNWDLSANDYRLYSQSGTSPMTSTGTYTEGEWRSVYGQNDGTGGTRDLIVEGSSEASGTGANQTFGDTFRAGASGDDFANVDIAEVFYFERNLTSGEWAQIHAGPELNYSSGVSFASDGTYDIGTWALPSPFASGSNGSQTQNVIAVNASGTILDGTKTTATGTMDISSEAGNTVYLLAQVSNTGGFDIGDKATRTSSYGSSNDGYYEIASVVAGGGGGTTTNYVHYIQADTRFGVGSGRVGVMEC